MVNPSAYTFPGIFITPDHLAKIASEVYNVPFELLYTKSHKRVVCEARFMSWFLIREILKLSQAKTGFPFKADHSSVCYGERIIITYAQYNKGTRVKFIKCCRCAGMSLERIAQILNSNKKLLIEIEDF